jgi:hypothetical protein
MVGDVAPLVVQFSGPPGAIPLDYEGILDTGFTAGIAGDLALKTGLEQRGYDFFDTTVSLADGKTYPAWSHEVVITSLVTPNGPLLLPSVVPTVLLCFEGAHHLIGLGALHMWVIEFDGPNREFRLYG